MRDADGPGHEIFRRLEDTRSFYRAVYGEYHTIIAEGGDAGSDDYIKVGETSRLMILRVRWRWSLITGERESKFPFTDGAVCDVYEAYRKSGDNNSPPKNNPHWKPKKWDQNALRALHGYDGSEMGTIECPPRGRA